MGDTDNDAAVIIERIRELLEFHQAEMNAALETETEKVRAVTEQLSTLRQRLDEKRAKEERLLEFVEQQQQQLEDMDVPAVSRFCKKTHRELRKQIEISKRLLDFVREF